MKLEISLQLLAVHYGLKVILAMNPKAMMPRTFEGLRACTRNADFNQWLFENVIQ